MKNNLSFFRGKLLFPVTALFACCICVQSQQVYIHSHNDYDQAVPFYRAFTSGAYSIEADVYTTDRENELLVAHNEKDLPSASTIEDLYLTPIVGLYKRNQGRARNNADGHFQLLVDLKTPTVPTLDILVSKLQANPDVFDPAVNPNAVRVVISGNMPAPADFSKYPSCVFFDGRLNQTYTQEELMRVPLFSEPFRTYSKWNGTGEMIEAEKKVLEALIEKAHALGKPIRFWGTPDNMTSWQALHDMGVDFINTDHPESCANYFSDRQRGCASSCSAATSWKAKWISFEQNQSKTNTWIAYRKDVTLSEKPSSLLARIATDTKYWLWINNRLVVFEGGLKRGPDRHATYYDEVEIAPYLTAGENTIAVLVWHFGKNGFNHLNSGTAALLFDAVSDDGTEIVSDASWKGMVYTAYQDTEAPFPNFRMPESNIRFDARREVAGWNMKGFSGRMSNVSLVAAVDDFPSGKLVKRPIPLWKDSGLMSYLNMRKSPDGDTLFCKLPYNCQITPYFKIIAGAGALIHVQTDNYMGGGSPNVRAEYVARDGEQEYESYGWMNGHEVWYVFPKGVEVLEVKYRETGYNTEFVEPFHCNDVFLNELWKRSARTLYITMRDNYMDCPDRERGQWWGDEVNELGEAFYALTPSSHQLALKGIHELMNWQRADGVILSPVPSGNWGSELPLQMLASVGWYGFYTQYFYSADSSFVPVIYDRLHRYLHEVWQVDADGLAIERAGEWSWGDWGQNVDMGVLTNCWYYLALKAEREFALQLNKTKDAADILRMMKRIENAFDGKFWTGAAYRTPEYKGETDDRAQAMAVVSGLAPKSRYPALTKALKTEYHASPYMEKYVLEALCQMGETVFAIERMKKRYEKMMSYEEYTTLFEGWGIGAEGFGGGTINHAWSGGPLTILSQKVCGVEPLTPGFRTFRIAPRLGSLTEASTTIASVYGEIKVSVHKKGRRLSISVTVPDETSCELVFPSGKSICVAGGKHTVEGS